MEHSHSGSSIKKRSPDRPHHAQISDGERLTKHPSLANVHQLHARTCRLTECGDDGEGPEKATGYSSQQVFLSHGGDSYNFVTQLFMDLKRENITSFFFKDPYSIPTDKKLPLIFRAARRCRVVVVVLSEDFIASEWPMIELCTFFGAQKISNPSLVIFPLYFKMSFAGLSEKITKKDVYTSWVNSKNPRTTGNTRIKLNEWLKALEALRLINGITYNQVEGEVACRRRIVDCIRCLLRQNLVHENPSVKGKQRLCQLVENLFDDIPYTKKGVKIAGLYGVGGSGKTTLCKSLCDFFSHEFKGKVFHVELQGRGCIETFKRALQVLAGTSKTLVRPEMSIEQRSFLLKKTMRGKVFLAIDNISDTEESIEEAQLYLNAVRSGSESRILLTARSLGVLERFIRSPESSSMHVPDLEEEEAIGVLLQPTPIKVSDLTCNGKDVALKCIQECRFTWYSDNGKKYRAYHPLVLKEFGQYLWDKLKSRADLSLWTDIPNLSNNQLGLLQKIFCVFEEGLKGLSPEHFTVFMHMCLYFPQPCMPCNQALIWLALVCDRDIEDIEYIIIQLKNRGFIAGESEFYIHDLVMDFAESHADGTGKWLSLKNAVEIPMDLQWASSNDRVRFEAMKLHNCEFQSMAGVNSDLLSDVHVLHLHDMGTLKTLDLKPMKMLRSLAIIGCRRLEEIQGIEVLSTLCYLIIKGCYRDLQFKGVEGLMALRYLELDLEDSEERLGNLPKGDFLEYPKLKGLRNLRTVNLCCGGRGTGIIDFTGCSNLDTIQLSRCGMTGLALEGCTRLTCLELEMQNLEKLPSLDFTGLTKLKLLGLVEMPNLGSLSAFNQLINLEHLTLEGIPNLVEFPITGFQCLTNLTHLYMVKMEKLKQIPSFTCLTKLKLLHLVEMPNLERLPALSQQFNLEHLTLEGMPNLEDFSSPGFQSLINLTDLYLVKMSKLKQIPSFTGLTKLKLLRLIEMPNLERLPPLSQLSKLENITLEGMQCLTNLSHLYLVKTPNLKKIPIFTRLTKLKVHLVEMPNSEGLLALSQLSNLETLCLTGMPNLEVFPIPDFQGLSNLTSLYLGKMPNLKEIPSFAGLIKLNSLHLVEMPHLEKVPCLGGLTHLHELVLSKMEKLSVLPSFGELIELKVLRLGKLQI